MYTTETGLRVVRVETEEEALKLSDLYISYYKERSLTRGSFLTRWKLANSLGNYYLYTAYFNNNEEPSGFIAYTIVPSIFWAPSLIRIDSIYIKDKLKENEIMDALFDEILTVMKAHNVTMISAASCSSYEQEIRILTKKLPIDNNPKKTFFTQTYS